MLNIWDVVLSTVIGNDEDRIWIIYPVDFWVLGSGSWTHKKEIDKY